MAKALKFVAAFSQWMAVPFLLVAVLLDIATVQNVWHDGVVVERIEPRQGEWHVVVDIGGDEVVAETSAVGWLNLPPGTMCSVSEERGHLATYKTFITGIRQSEQQHASVD